MQSWFFFFFFALSFWTLRFALKFALIKNVDKQNFNERFKLSLFIKKNKQFVSFLFVSCAKLRSLLVYKKQRKTVHFFFSSPTQTSLLSLLRKALKPNLAYPLPLSCDKAFPHLGDWLGNHYSSPRTHKIGDPLSLAFPFSASVS